MRSVTRISAPAESALLVSILVSYACAQAEPYLTQTYIDTMIQRAFFSFNDAVSLTGGQEERLTEAIGHAKTVCRDLRQRAKGDPNEKYILWKVGELENHVILEERDLILRKMRKGQATTNQLVAQFNAELAKSRPDFSKLWSYHGDMRAIGAAKAGELEYSIRHRSRNLSREIGYAMEKAVIRGDIQAMRTDLAYCTTYGQYLNVAVDKYRALEEKLKAREHHEDLRRDLDGRLSTMARQVSANRFREVWTEIGDLQATVGRLRADLPPSDAYRYDVAIALLVGEVNSREDSLVALGLRILETQGAEAAIDYVDTTLRANGVSLLKTARVDSAIVAVAGLSQGTHDEAIRRELDDLSQSTSYRSLTLENARQIAARRAQARADSLRAIAEAEAMRLARENSSKIAREAKLEKKRKKERQKAQEVIVAAYALLEGRKIAKARKLFEKKRARLEEYASPEVFAMLEATVTQEREASDAGVRHDDEQAETSPVRMVAENPLEPPVTEPVTVAESVSHPGPLVRDSAEAARKNQEKAQKYVVELYQLLEQNRIAEAHATFTRIRTPLSRYVCAEAFQMLESSIEQSYRYLQEYQQAEHRPPTFSPSATGR